MSGYQFTHTSAYSSTRPVARGKNGKKTGTGERRWSAADVLDEATREPGSVPHIDSPSTPTWLLGSRAAIEQAGQDWASNTRYESGRKVRSDAPWLAASVVSMPKDRLSDWPEFRDQALSWYIERYGADRVIGAVEHLDEPHPHMHIYAVPKPGEEFGVVHDGFAAKTATRRAGDTKVTSAFKTAMILFQDAFQNGVAWMHGLTRSGPKRERLTRADWQSKQAESDAAARLTDINEHVNIADRELISVKKETEEKKQFALIARQLAAAQAEAQAMSMRTDAILVAQQVVSFETQRIRKKGAEYFKAERGKIRAERAEVRAEGRAVQAAHVALNDSSGMTALASMRERIEMAEAALTMGELGAAATHIDAAKLLDPAPSLPVSKRRLAKP